MQHTCWRKRAYRWTCVYTSWRPIRVYVTKKQSPERVHLKGLGEVFFLRARFQPLVNVSLPFSTYMPTNISIWRKQSNLWRHICTRIYLMSICPRFSYWLKPWQFNDIHEVFIAPDSNFCTRWSNRLRIAVESTLGRRWIGLGNGRINGRHANVTFNLLLNITCNVH